MLSLTLQLHSHNVAHSRLDWTCFLGTCISTLFELYILCPRTTGEAQPP